MEDSKARLFDATGENIGTYRLEVMDTFWKRFMGLMGRDDVPIGNAALFRKCSSIHMFFMKIPLMSFGTGHLCPMVECPFYRSRGTSSLGDCLSARSTRMDASKSPPVPSPRISMRSRL